MDKIAAGMIQCSKISSSTNHGHLVSPPTTAAGIGKKTVGATPPYTTASPLNLFVRGEALVRLCRTKASPLTKTLGVGPYHFSRRKASAFMRGESSHNLFVMDSIHNPYLDL